MKYYISLMAILALVGAGCAKSQTPNEVSTTTTDVEEPPFVIEVLPVDDGSNATTEESEVTITEESATPETDDVPIVEIVLDEEPVVDVEMEVKDFSFNPNVINASPGDRIKVTFTKVTGFHTFVIDEIDLKFSINEGEAVIFNAPDEPGEYPFYCDVDLHRTFGLEGMLIVE